MIRTSLNVAYLSVTGVVLIAIAVSFLVFRPMLITLSQQRMQNQERDKTITERNTFLKSLESKQNMLDQEKTSERVLSVALPESDSFDDVVRILQRSATTAGGTIRTINNTSVEQQRNALIRQGREGEEQLFQSITPLGADIEFIGSYQQLRVFLGELEKSPRLIDVMSLDISRSDKTTDIITVKMSLRFYHYGSPAPQ